MFSARYFNGKETKRSGRGGIPPPDFSNHNYPKRMGFMSAVNCRFGRARLVFGAMLAAVLLFGAAAKVSALDVSVGWTGVFMTDSKGLGGFASGVYGMSTNANLTRWEKNPWSGWGVSMFTEIGGYFASDIGFTFAGGSPGGTMSGNGSIKDVKYSMTLFDLGFLGKYPIPLGFSLKVYPAVGFGVAFSLGGKTEYTYNNEKYTDKWDGDYNMDTWTKNPENVVYTWFKFGGGFDYDISGNLFFRVQALYGVGSVGMGGYDGDDDLNLVSGSYSGLTIRVGAGLKL